MSRLLSILSGSDRAWILVVIIALGALWPASDARAQLTDQQQIAILSEAQQEYDQGIALRRSNPERARQAFAESAARFRQLIDSGIRNGGLYFNLANAYLQAGDLGRAILHYREAERFMPGDARLEHNLEYARSLRADQLTPSGERALMNTLLAWHRDTPRSVRFSVALAAWLAFWFASFALLFRPAGVWRWLAAMTAVIWLIAGASIAADLAVGDGAREGVLIADEVVVRKGNGLGFEPQFEQPLSSGVEFEVLDERGGWLHIELVNGKTGWIAADQAGLIGD
jgi:tetratricopeptide (TPR) repeat protein